MESEQAEHVRNLIAAQRRRLNALELQAVRYGIDCPAHISIEIQDIQEQISEYERQINENPPLLERQVNQTLRQEKKPRNETLLLSLLAENGLSDIGRGISKIEDALKSVEVNETREFRFRVMGIVIWVIQYQRTVRILLTLILSIGATLVPVEGLPPFSSLGRPITAPNQETPVATQLPSNITGVAAVPTHTPQYGTPMISPLVTPAAVTANPDVTANPEVTASAVELPVPTPQAAVTIIATVGADNATLTALAAGEPIDATLTAQAATIIAAGRTPVVAIETPTPLETPSATLVSTIEPTAMITATSALTPTLTPTITPTATLTPIPTSTVTSTPTMTSIVTPTITSTFAPTSTGELFTAPITTAILTPNLASTFQYKSFAVDPRIARIDALIAVPDRRS